MNGRNVSVLLVFGLAVISSRLFAEEDYSQIRGVNYVPSYARNDLQIWNEFDAETIDRELGYAEKLKLNTVRVFLQYVIYEQDPDTFMANFETLLTLCEKHNIRLMPVVFDSCFGEFPDLENYRDKDWMANPGQNRIGPEFWPELDAYAISLVEKYREDERIIMWDVMNEPYCTSFANDAAEREKIGAFLSHELDVIREQANPTQPMTVGFMASRFWTPEMIDRVDVISWHNYTGDMDLLRADIRHVKALGEEHGKQVVINEIAMRSSEQYFWKIMPLLAEENIGWVFWELMLGKTPFSRGDAPIQGVVYPDGTCWDHWEIAAIMNPPCDEIFNHMSLKKYEKLFLQRPDTPEKSMQISRRMLFTDTRRADRPFAKDPDVVRINDSYFMYYSNGPDASGRWAIGIAKSQDLFHWETVGEIAPEAGYEANGLVAGAALMLDGKVHLFYSTYGNGTNDAICHAWSEDGIHFIRDETNPIFSPTGDWNNGRAIDSDAIVFNDELLLVCATRDPSGSIQMLVGASAPLDSAYQRQDWTQTADKPLMQPELPWETRCIEAPTMLIRNETLHLFYGGGYNCNPQQLAVATSKDGLTWERMSNRPLVPQGLPGSWNASETGHPGVFTDEDGSQYVFHQGSPNGGKTWCLSCLELSWDDEGFPVLTRWDGKRFEYTRLPKGFINDTDPTFEYDEGWTCYNGFHGPLGDSLHFANTSGSTLEFTFEGTGATLFHKAGPDCGFMEIIVDGKPYSDAEASDVIDTYSLGVFWNQQIVLGDDLPEGKHTVRVIATGQKRDDSTNTYVQIVGVQIAP